MACLLKEETTVHVNPDWAPRRRASACQDVTGSSTAQLAEVLVTEWSHQPGLRSRRVRLTLSSCGICDPMLRGGQPRAQHQDRPGGPRGGAPGPAALASPGDVSHAPIPKPRPNFPMPLRREPGGGGPRAARWSEASFSRPRRLTETSLMHFHRKSQLRDSDAARSRRTHADWSSVGSPPLDPAHAGPRPLGSSTARQQRGSQTSGSHHFDYLD